MPDLIPANSRNCDRTNAMLAALVFLGAFIVYALTVQRSFSFWDCGEFIASSYILGIPHPPGTPLLMLINRIFSIIPFVEDISYRVNYVSVISSSFTAMFSYLLTVRLVKHFLRSDEENGINRVITYVGGVAGGFFVAFSATNWGNSVEAEAYGLGLALSVCIVWLTMRYFEQRGTMQAAATMVMAMYLGMLGLGVHMTVFLVVPVCAIFFILKKEADWKDYLMVCAYVLLELVLILVFSDGRGGSGTFKIVSVILGALLMFKLYKKIHWGILIAIATCSSVMIAFSLYFMLLPIGIAGILILAYLGKQMGFSIQWKTALAIIVIGFVGFSSHLYIPIRSAHNPRIDENNPSRSFQTFVDFLDRKQYGQVSMVDRMFVRRGALENQFGRHIHMGFWSYFEEQYSEGGWKFAPFFILGLLGAIVAIRKRLEIGLPFFTLLMVCSVGLILYMNFADGTQYNTRSGDAYLEVRNRDYFFTPAFVFFGIAMGMGVSALMQYVKDIFRASDSGIRRTVTYACCVLVLLPAISLGHNYHTNDRSNNFLPRHYAQNLLDSCDKNAILFTAGDNDTFPVWCLQEVYDYRKDVRVVNLSLLNTDWYVAQMKNRYDVPIGLTDEQILWNDYELADGDVVTHPAERFLYRPRGIRTYLVAQPFNGGALRVADMITDEIVLGNKFEHPIYFSSPPNASSPLKLREKAVQTGQVFKLELNPPERLIDVDRSFDLFTKVYRYDGMESSEVFRDDNATGVSLGVGMSTLRVYDALLRDGDTTRAVALMEHMIKVYPEYWQPYDNLSELARRTGDSVRALALQQQLHDTLAAFVESNPSNYYYLQDLGTTKVELGRLTGNEEMIDAGIELVWDAFDINPNSNYTWRKLIMVLNQTGRHVDMMKAARRHGEYGRNLSDPYLQQLLGRTVSGR